MNNTITIYELLGLIKDGKAPKKIEYNDLECIYDDDYKNYYIPDCVEYLIDGMNIVDDLNNKVEILEEGKPIIEKIEINKYKFHNDNHGKLLKNQEKLENKLNQIIDYINRKEDK